MIDLNLNFGLTYHETRKAEPRLAAAIMASVGDVKVSTILDIGSGISTYAYFFAEQGYKVFALEPSEVMRAQAQKYYSHKNITQILCAVEDMHSEKIEADIAMCILSSHHFSNLRVAFEKIRKVKNLKKIVIFTVDHRLCTRFWFADYFPKIWDYAQNEMTFSLSAQIEIIKHIFSKPPEIAEWFVPRNCQDLFFGARWESPELYTDRKTFQNTTPLMRANQSIVNAGIEDLLADLQTGEWTRKYSDVLKRDSLDLGHRILTMEP